MTTYEIAWGVDDGQPTGKNIRTVRTPDEVDGVLDELEADGPSIATVYPAGGDLDGPSMQIGAGHPQRAFVAYFGPEGDGYGQEPSVNNWPHDIDFDYGGQLTAYLPERTRITPKTARLAIREFVATGTRPASLDWPDDIL